MAGDKRQMAGNKSFILICVFKKLRLYTLFARVHWTDWTHIIHKQEEQMRAFKPSFDNANWSRTLPPIDCWRRCKLWRSSETLAWLMVSIWITWIQSPRMRSRVFLMSSNGSSFVNGGIWIFFKMFSSMFGRLPIAFLPGRAFMLIRRRRTVFGSSSSYSSLSTLKRYWSGLVKLKIVTSNPSFESSC